MQCACWTRGDHTAPRLATSSHTLEPTSAATCHEPVLRKHYAMVLQDTSFNLRHGTGTHTYTRSDHHSTSRVCLPGNGRLSDAGRRCNTENDCMPVPSHTSAGVGSCSAEDVPLPLLLFLDKLVYLGIGISQWLESLGENCLHVFCFLVVSPAHRPRREFLCPASCQNCVKNKRNT